MRKEEKILCVTVSTTQPIIIIIIIIIIISELNVMKKIAAIGALVVPVLR